MYIHLFKTVARSPYLSYTDMRTAGYVSYFYINKLTRCSLYNNRKGLLSASTAIFPEGKSPCNTQKFCLRLRAKLIIQPLPLPPEKKFVRNETEGNLFVSRDLHNQSCTKTQELVLLYGNKTPPTKALKTNCHYFVRSTQSS